MALSANTSLPTRNRGGMTRHSFTVLSAATIYKHSMVVITAAGLAKVAANETTTSFVGIAEEAPTGVGDGSVTVTVVNNLEVLLPLVTAITVGDSIVDKIYAVDDQTGTTENTLGPEIGIMSQFVAANSGWVLLRQAPTVVAS